MSQVLALFGPVTTPLWKIRYTWLVAIFATVFLLATQPVRAAESESDPLPALARVILVPELSATIGTGALFFGDIRGAVGLRLGDGIVGIVGEHASIIGNGLSGCETARFCLRTRDGIGGFAEYHFRVGKTFEPWIGLRWTMIASRGEPLPRNLDTRLPEERRWGTILTPQVGLDVLAHWNRGQAGAGVYIALPLGGVSDAEGFGLTIGIRAPIGLF